MLIALERSRISYMKKGDYGDLLSASVRGGHADITALFLQNGCDARIHSETVPSRCSLRSVAAFRGQYEVVELLPRREFLPKFASRSSSTFPKFVAESDAVLEDENAILAAAEGGHQQIVDLLLASPDSDKLPSNLPTKILCTAAQYGHLHILRSGIAKSGNINSHGQYLRQRPQGLLGLLSLACSNGHTEVVEFLLAEGADPARGTPLCRPMDLAAEYGSVGIGRRLRDAGANLEETSMIAAAAGGHARFVEFMLDNRDEVDAFGLETTLYTAARFGHISVVKMVAGAGVDT